MSFPVDARLDASERPPFQGFGFTGLKKRGHGSRSWIQIDRNGNSHILALDKATLMRRCNLPARDLRLLDPLFVYPSTILGREKAIVVNLEQIRCIITADEVILMNSLDSSVMQYQSELCRRLQTQKDQNGCTESSSDDLAFEFRALELALELTCMSLDAQVTELEIDVYPVLDELASSISTLNLERVRKQKSHLLALTHRVQKVRDEIEQLMDDDGDMAEMYLTEKKERMEAYPSAVPYFLSSIPAGSAVSKSAPVSPVSSISGSHKLDKMMSSVIGSSKHGSSSSGGDRIEELEMLLEAYFVVIDNTLSKLLSLKEYIDDTEDFINIKLDNVRNQLIQFELLLTAATFVATIFAVVSGVFGMNFTPAFFQYPDNFNWVLIVTSISCVVIYAAFILYFKHKRLLPL
ncbi:magnesium transporter MRS2-5-like [Magnolia sinica]|uniref:magnesium transporter MRS2-5-like n=1 Tax=Magnolia sinica TaxID=86752 RepID=UPI00265B69E8|nr:magnesium transporter MRS2-5-like [Magnolia sinica]XP_058070448.1 magnesium transporter MRS2-5-like [Magnolia sinica]